MSAYIQSKLGVRSYVRSKVLNQLHQVAEFSRMAITAVSLVGINRRHQSAIHFDLDPYFGHHAITPCHKDVIMPWWRISGFRSRIQL